MTPRIAVLALLLLASAAARAENYTATLYEQGSQRAKTLYTMTSAETMAGGALASVRRVYTAVDGKEAALEEATFEAGRLKTFRLDLTQAGEQGRMEVSGGKLVFSYTAHGKTETASEDAAADLTVPATVVPFLHARWDELAAGKKVTARLAALERRETVGFQWTVEEQTTVEGRPAMVVVMKPSSFIIAALVKPIRMTFDKESRRLLEYWGRTPPKRQVDGKWEPLDIDAVFRY
jgi:hypothetical protein